MPLREPPNTTTNVMPTRLARRCSAQPCPLREERGTGARSPGVNPDPVVGAAMRWELKLVAAVVAAQLFFGVSLLVTPVVVVVALALAWS